MKPDRSTVSGVIREEVIMLHLTGHRRAAEALRQVAETLERIETAPEHETATAHALELAARIRRYRGPDAP